MNIKRVFLLLFFLFWVLVTPVFADLVNPDYYRAKCPAGTIEIECSYHSEEVYGPRTYNECVGYENNPSYTNISSEGHSFGGREKYCFKPASPIVFLFYHLKAFFPLFMLTLFFELPIFFVFGFRGKRAYGGMLLANAVSTFLLYIVTLFTAYSGLLSELLPELFIIIFEAALIRFFMKNVSWKRILLYSFVANIVSFVFGAILLSILERYFADYIVMIMYAIQHPR